MPKTYTQWGLFETRKEAASHVKRHRKLGAKASVGKCVGYTVKLKVIEKRSSKPKKEVI